jgi:phospholipid/cholesterol/gamma-HCH transport system substrate-binding protein
VLLVALGVNADKLPFLTDDVSYSARFPEAAGIDKENEVRIAGVRVGSVKGVRLDGAEVEVTFTVDGGIALGDRTRAAIKLKTLLGTKFLDVQPAGAGELPEGAVIPRERTEVPFQIYDTFDRLSGNLDEIDVRNLAKAFDVLSDTFRDTGDNSQAALEGLQQVSRTIASRDAELRRLLASSRVVAGALSERDVELTRLLGDAELVLQVVRQRRAVISSLLDSTARLAAELTSLVRDNRAVIDPLLRDLHQVAEVLRANLGALDRSVELLGPFTRYGANANGNGRWLDVYSENFVVSDEVLCQINPGSCAP